MRTTRNRVYRKLYRGFESPYLRQKIKILKHPQKRVFLILTWAEIGGCARAPMARSAIRKFYFREK